MLSSPTEEASTSLQFTTFFSTFVRAKGAISIVIISAAISIGIGCTVSVLPEIISDRYARLNHNYEGELPCSSFDSDTMPLPCRQGADDAQASSAWSSLLQNMLTLFLNAVVGSLSDVYGRRIVFIVCTFLNTLAPIVLVLIQLWPAADPVLWYVSNALTGIISYMSITFAILSDTMPVEFRAPSFGIIMAAFYSGFAFSPFMALLLNHLHVSLVSAGLVTFALVYAILFFPETLPESNRAITTLVHQDQLQEHDEVEHQPPKWFFQRVCSTIIRPFQDMAILRRAKTLKLIAIGSFFGSMVYSTDANLVVFYIEQHLNVREADIARMFLVMGTVGVTLEVVLLQPLIAILGEKGLLVTSFVSGTTHNFLYGIAKNKQTLFMALCLSQLTRTNTPVLSSIASKGAAPHEQGQLQGALFAVGSLGAAFGPIFMQFIYSQTKDTFGPGTMFLFASFLYFIGTIFVSFVPAKVEPASSIAESHDLEEPLLRQTNESNSVVVDVDEETTEKNS